MTEQLIRRDPSLPPPERQVEVLLAFGQQPAYLDLAWPELGVFLELDGEQHKEQPLYDATRQTAVIAATHWLVGRYTWTDIVHNPLPTLRSIARLLKPN
jgi:very-short-patch-repair endonuclease